MNNNVLEENDRIQRTFQEQILFESSINNLKKKCKCGHTQLVPRKKSSEYSLCTHCHGRLYPDDKKQKEYNYKRDKEEFMFQLRKVLCYDEKTIF